MIAALLPALIPILGDVLKRAIPDPEAQAKAQTELTLALAQNAQKLEELGANIVKSEAEGESWLQRNWRPMTMLTFVGLIVARMLGFAAPGISEAEYLALWNIMEFGLGGYVVARSAEKIAPQVAQALRRN